MVESKKLRVFEAFSGIGAQRKALGRLGINHDVVAISEIDKYAIKSYEAVHGKTNNLGDISKLKVGDIPDHDLFTYSFPCTDISGAGLQKGFDEGSGTRSSLLWECKKVIEGKKPKYLLMENVKALVSKKFKPTFDKWCEWLESQGYTNYWQVLNAKDYGVPQNRERVFMISILGVHEPYAFPEKQELHIRLKDVLEKEVDSKFYLSEEKVSKLVSRFDLKDESFLLGGEQKNQSIKKDGISTTLTSSMGTGGGHIPMVNRIGNGIAVEYIPAFDGKKHQSNTVYAIDNVSPATQATDYKSPIKILIKNAVKAGGESADGIYLNASGKFQRGSLKDLSRTLKANNHDAGAVLVNEPKVINNDELPIIRKLTPKECWRLMGFDDSDFEKAEQVNSNTQLYKQAGNSIVVNCLDGIFYELFKNTEYMEV